MQDRLLLYAARLSCFFSMLSHIFLQRGRETDMNKDIGSIDTVGDADRQTECCRSSLPHSKRHMAMRTMTLRLTPTAMATKDDDDAGGTDGGSVLVVAGGNDVLLVVARGDDALVVVGGTTGGQWHN